MNSFWIFEVPVTFFRGALRKNAVLPRVDSGFSVCLIGSRISVKTPDFQLENPKFQRKLYFLKEFEQTVGYFPNNLCQLE